MIKAWVDAETIRVTSVRCLLILVFCLGYFSPLQAARLQLNKHNVIQGQTIQAILEVSSALQKSECKFNGQPCQIFKLAPQKWQVLIGTDVTTPTGSYSLIYLGNTLSGNTIQLQTTINISQGHFKRSIVEIPKAKKSIATPVKIENEAKIIGPIFDQKSSLKRWRGYFGWPVRGEITTPYGACRVYDNGAMVSWHRGVDIYAPLGTPVFAPNNGVVILSRIFASHGQTIMIDHGHSVVTIYNHLSKRLVSKGDLVKKGSRIGLIGDTGIATGPHLHWGLSVGGVRVDPLFWLSSEID